MRALAWREGRALLLQPLLHLFRVHEIDGKHFCCVCQGYCQDIARILPWDIAMGLNGVWYPVMKSPKCRSGHVGWVSGLIA
jgi:hypothetical protein